MAKKIYKTAGGQTIDMGQLMAKNEEVRAVGNMNVNARGDVIDNSNKTTSTRSAQVNKNYRKQTGNVARDIPVTVSKEAAEAKIVGLDEVPATKVETVVEEVPGETAGGLATAIAKTKDKTSK